MIDESAVSAAFNAARHLSGAEAFAAASSEVTTGLHRLEGAYYGSAGYKAIKQLQKSRLKLSTVGAVTSIQWLGPMARTYVDSKETGVPFLSSSDMMEAQLIPDKYVSKELTRRLHELLVEPGTILVSRSGTVGNVALCTSNHNRIAVSEHAIRVRLRHGSDDLRGLVYCLLQSHLGQYLLTRNKSGSVIETLYADDVGSLPLPQLPRSFRVELTRLIDSSCKMRVKANRLLDDAQEQVQRSCYLPPFDEMCKDRRSCFVISSSAISDRQMGPGDIRLDATAFDPVADRVRNFLATKERSTTLGKLSERIHRIAPGKRTYVDDHLTGYPLVGGKQMMQWRMRDVKFISRALTVRNARQTCVPGTTLIATGGTIGRTMYVHRNFEDAIASEDVMRVIPAASIKPGFIYAYLSSPYAQIQIQQRVFGSVIPRIRHFHLPSLRVPGPLDAGESVHACVVSAFDARADARAAEDHAINLFEEAIRRGRSYVEAEWGAEY